MSGAKTKRFQFGFSLLELMVTVAVLAITITAALPSFTSTIQNNRLTSQANQFISALQLARNSAVSRNQRITLCKSSDGSSCTTSGDWSQGWIIFIDSNSNATVDSGEELLRVQTSLGGNTTLNGETDVADYISYVATGASQLSNGDIQQGNLVLCDARGFVSQTKAINLNSTGRPRTGDASTMGLASCSP